VWQQPSELFGSTLQSGATCVGFDPPHLGHLEIIKKALDQLDIDRLIVVPAFISPFKKGYSAPPQQRLTWLTKMTADDPRIEVSDIEVQKGGASYTIETVNYFSQFFDTIYLIIKPTQVAPL